VNTATCQTCRHFSALHNTCRANPPQPFVVGMGPSGPQVIGVFPPVTKDHGCGHHVPDQRLALS
jgi:hypothetical protein